jgi:hypothetical protein
VESISIATKRVGLRLSSYRDMKDVICRNIRLAFGQFVYCKEKCRPQPFGWVCMRCNLQRGNTLKSGLLAITLTKIGIGLSDRITVFMVKS